MYARAACTKCGRVLYNDLPESAQGQCPACRHGIERQAVSMELDRARTVREETRKLMDFPGKERVISALDLRIATLERRQT